jgi:hypothetical protein
MTNPFCVKLYCDAPSLLQGIIEPQDCLCLELRSQVHDLVKSSSDCAEYLGGSGSTTTWNIDEGSMISLLRKIQEFNGQKNELPVVIHMELY